MKIFLMIVTQLVQRFIYYNKDKEYKPHFDSWDFDCPLPRSYKSMD